MLQSRIISLKKGFKLPTLQYRMLTRNLVPYPLECHGDYLLLECGND